MKKIFTYLALGLTTFAVQAQVTETELLNETFVSGVDASLSTTGELLRSPSIGFDAEPGIGQLDFVAFGGLNGLEAVPNLDWISSSSTDADSVIVEFKIGKSIIFSGYVSTFGSQLDASAADIIPLTYSGIDVPARINYFFSENYDLVSDEGDYYVAQKVYSAPFSSTFNVINMSGYIEYEIDGNYGSDPLQLATEYCAINFPGDFLCVGELAIQVQSFHSPFILLIDDVKVTAYKTTITGIENEVYNDKQVLAVYNLMGQQASLETTNEMIIVRYTDGTSERIFNVR